MLAATPVAPLILCFRLLHRSALRPRPMLLNDLGCCNRSTTAFPFCITLPIAILTCKSCYLTLPSHSSSSFRLMIVATVVREDQYHLEIEVELSFIDYNITFENPKWAGKALLFHGMYTLQLCLHSYLLSFVTYYFIYSVLQLLVRT